MNTKKNDLLIIDANPIFSTVYTMMKTKHPHAFQARGEAAPKTLPVTPEYTGVRSP